MIRLDSKRGKNGALLSHLLGQKNPIFLSSVRGSVGRSEVFASVYIGTKVAIPTGDTVPPRKFIPLQPEAIA